MCRSTNLNNKKTSSLLCRTEGALDPIGTYEVEGYGLFIRAASYDTSDTLDPEMCLSPPPH